jgi:prepilin signal peptidase PulO-like enzyme (type II secretory pathway)
MCPHCHHKLGALDLIPVFSYLVLGGKCRYCQRPISRSYPAVELLTGSLFALSYLALLPQTSGEWLKFVAWLYVLASLIFLAVYDLRWMLLPDRVLVPATGVWLLVLAVGALHQPGNSLSHLGAGLLVGGVFYALVAASGGRWLGGGDIKLVFLMGILLGGSKLLLALFLAFNSAALVGVGLIAAKLKSRKDNIPFGPFLVAATIAAYLYGHTLIELYLRLSGLK